jgi:hypothetical protein
MPPSQLTGPRVFISYSHDSPEHMDRVLELSNRLRVDGVDCTIDQYEVSPPKGWPRWMGSQIEDADYVLVVCTEIYEQRFKGKAEKGKGLGAKWEGAVITQELYDAEADNTKFIPVVFTPRDPAHIPVVLRGVTYYELYTEEGYEKLYRHITGQPNIIKPELGHLLPMPPRERQQVFPSPKTDADKNDRESLDAAVSKERVRGPSDSRQDGSQPKRDKHQALGLWVIGIIGGIAVLIFLLWLWSSPLAPVKLEEITRENPITKVNLIPLPQLKTESGVNEVALTRDGELAASAEESGIVHIWRVRSGDQPRALEKSGKPLATRCIAIGPNGNMIAAGSTDGKIRLWPSSNDPKPKVIESHTDSVYQVYFSPDGQRLASSGSDRQDVKSVRLWRITKGIELLKTFNIPDFNDQILTVSPDLQFVAIFSSQNKRIEIWSLIHSRLATVLENSDFVIEGGGAFSQDGKLFTAGSNWGVVRLWQMTDGKQLKDLAGPRNSVISIAFHPNGRIIAAGYPDGSISVWDIDSDEPPTTVKEHGQEVLSVTFSGNGAVLAAGGEDGKIQLWEIVGEV